MQYLVIACFGLLFLSSCFAISLQRVCNQFVRLQLVCNEFVGLQLACNKFAINLFVCN